MNELFSLAQSVPWTAIGGALVLLNLVLLALKITKKLLLLAVGAALIAVGVYTGVLPAPAAPAGLALPPFPLP